MTTRATPFLSLLVLALASACSSSTSTSPGATGTNAQAIAGDPRSVLENYAANLNAAYADSVKDEDALVAAVATFGAAPSEAQLTAVKTAWLASRAHYMLTEGARFVGGPIDVDPPNDEALVNSWPLDESYIDYTTDRTTGAVLDGGFVGTPSLMPTIDIASIDAANAQGGDTNISDGWHAAEFLIWGQPRVDVGPGARPFTDYTTRANADRRKTYLAATVAGISTHLAAVRDAWATGAPYRTTFVANEYASVALALTGLGRFSKGELASQRLDAGYQSKDRRDQHDCFSSASLTDYERDARGVQGLYLGNYGTNDGPGLDTLVAKVDAALDARVRAALQASVDAVIAIRTSTASGTFEEAVAGADTAPGRLAVRDAVTKLRAQADLFAEAASALGLTIVVPATN